MRPVEKKKPGEEIEIEKASGEKSKHIILQDYKNYRDAKLPLVTNIGSYCSYCEAHIDVFASIDVEHVQPKSIQAGLKTKWSNFLLACPTCNGSANKGDKVVDLTKVQMPDSDNTFPSFIYKPDGSVDVNSNLTLQDYSRAEELYKLVGLNKHPGMVKPSDADFRWKKRFETWEIAQERKAEYDNHQATPKAIVGFAKSKGFWSIWYTVFEDRPEIKELLLSEFPGTATSCFDSTNNYAPIPRK